MINKMAARVLTYELGLSSYGNSKLEKSIKLKKDKHLAVFKPGLWQMGFFRCGKERYHFQKQLMVSKKLFNPLTCKRQKTGLWK